MSNSVAARPEKPLLNVCAACLVGKALVGHVRYDWLHQLQAKDRTGMLSKNSLEVLLADPTAGGLVMLAITLGKHETATSVADQVARRAAGYELAHHADEPSHTHMQAYA